MLKRFLIAVFILIVAIGLIIVGASMIFSVSYADVTALEEQANTTASGFGDTIIETTEETVPDQATEDIGTSDTVENGIITADTEDTMDTAAKARLLTDELTLTEKICQMLFVTQEVLTGYSVVTKSGSATQAAIEEYPVGGIVYFGQNLISVEQTTEMITNIQNYSRATTGIGLFIGVDEEGGSVARLANNLGTAAFEDMSVYGAEGDISKAYEIGTTLAQEMKAIGFNVDFAPVADVLTNDENQVVQTRSFGSDPELVAELVAQEVAGFTDSGVLCATKHFPGHGSTGGDTHDGFAASDRTLEELEACDLIPFVSAIEAGTPMIMVGHMTMTEIDSENPASLSESIITGILREQLGYEGIVITDAMNMGAITEVYTAGEAAVKAIAAGCDMLLCVSDIAEVIEAVTQAIEEGILTEERIDESVVRILTAKIEYGIIS